ncbi:MAG: hypothetical protein ACU841_06505 [Gammaproteobacteria bacterium]
MSDAIEQSSRILAALQAGFSLRSDRGEFERMRARNAVGLRSVTVAVRTVPDHSAQD